MVGWKQECVWVITHGHARLLAGEQRFNLGTKAAYGISVSYATTAFSHLSPQADAHACCHKAAVRSFETEICKVIFDSVNGGQMHSRIAVLPLRRPFGLEIEDSGEGTEIGMAPFTLRKYRSQQIELWRNVGEL